MNARIGLGISAASVAALLASPALAQGAVTVIGGGLGQACYEAVEYNSVPAAKALDICSRALETEVMKRRDKAATHTNRGILFMRMGNNTRALWDYERSLAMEPGLPETQVNVGAALYNLKRYPEALEALNAGLSAAEDDARAVGHYNRGLTNEKLGNLQLAYEDFQAALDLKPDFELAAMQIKRFTVIPAGS